MLPLPSSRATPTPLELKQLLDQSSSDQLADPAKSIVPSILGYKSFLILNPGALGIGGDLLPCFSCPVAAFF